MFERSVSYHAQSKSGLADQTEGDSHGHGGVNSTDASIV